MAIDQGLSDNSKVAGMSLLWNWYQAFKSFFNSRLSTAGDITLDTAGKGIVLTNKAGTVVKRVFLKDDGSGVDVESL